MQKHYLIIDCNSFYASAEKIFRPELRNSPVVVLSNNDGIIVALSGEAKELGFKRGDAIFKKQAAIQRHQVAVFSSNYVFYYDISRRIENIVKRFYPKVEKYSIDEMFVEHLSDKSAEALKAEARELLKAIADEIKMPVSIGIAPTKTLSKVMNRYAKKDKRYKGVAMLKDTGQIERALKNFRVSDVWGIGRQHSKKLALFDIHTALQFSRMPDAWIRKEFTVTGLRTAHELRGIPTVSMEYVRPDKKNILCSRSFGKPVSTEDDMKAAVADYTEEIGEKLRDQRSLCKTVSVFLLTDPFKKQHSQYRNSVSMELPYAANDTMTLLEMALWGLKLIFKEGYIYKKAGVAVYDLIPEENMQYTLWDDTRKIFKRKQLFKQIDYVNTSLGRIRFACQNPEGIHKMRQVRKSPHYTTDINEVPKIDMDKEL